MPFFIVPPKKNSFSSKQAILRNYFWGFFFVESIFYSRQQKIPAFWTKGTSTERVNAEQSVYSNSSVQNNAEQSGHNKNSVQTRCTEFVTNIPQNGLLWGNFYYRKWIPVPQNENSSKQAILRIFFAFWELRFWELFFFWGIPQTEIPQNRLFWGL